MRNPSSCYLGLVLVVLADLTLCPTQAGAAICHSNGSFTCGPLDIDHSILIECDDGVCEGRKRVFNSGGRVDWNTRPGEIIHIQSTRAGSRLDAKYFDSLDYIEDDETRMLDINTTLYIDTSKTPDNDKPRKLIGIGATIDYFDLEKAIYEDNFNLVFKTIFGALFEHEKQGAYFSLIRLLVHPKEDRTIDLFKALVRLDTEINNMIYNHPYDFHKKLKILVEVHDKQPHRLDLTAGKLSFPLDNIQAWAVADETGSFFPKEILRNLSKPLLFRSVWSYELPDLLDDSSLKNAQGLLIRSMESVPYEHLRKARVQVGPKKPILTVGRRFPRSASLGDWQTAQASSIELMNLLYHGSDGYIEDRTIVDVFREPEVEWEASIYSLQRDYLRHLRGPKFYTTAHFSRYLDPGSKQLKTDLFTQPNMFAAHYSAFMSPDSKHVISIVSNENEHLLPLRLAINGRIKTMVNLEPKSINTFIINMAQGRLSR